MNFLALQTLPPSNPDVSLTLLAPELIVSVAGVLVMLLDAFTRRSDRRWLTGGVALAGLIAAGAACVWLWRMPLAEDYLPALDSPIADANNAPGNPGGTTAPGPCANPRNPHSSGPALRALIVALEQWVTKGVAPPESRVPRSPIAVSYCSGRRMMKSCARAAFAAC